MKNLVLCLTLIFSGLFLSAPLFAHHGEVNYDTEKVVSVKGTVTDFQFINPHVQIFLDVERQRRDRKMELRSQESDHACPRGWLGQGHAQARRRHHCQWLSNEERIEHAAPSKDRTLRRPRDGQSVEARSTCREATGATPITARSSLAAALLHLSQGCGSC